MNEAEARAFIARLQTLGLTRDDRWSARVDEFWSARVGPDLKSRSAPAIITQHRVAIGLGAMGFSYRAHPEELGRWRSTCPLCLAPYAFRFSERESDQELHFPEPNNKAAHEAWLKGTATEYRDGWKETPLHYVTLGCQRKCKPAGWFVKLLSIDSIQLATWEEVDRLRGQAAMLRRMVDSGMEREDWLVAAIVARAQDDSS